MTDPSVWSFVRDLLLWCIPDAETAIRIALFIWRWIQKKRRNRKR